MARAEFEEGLPRGFLEKDDPLEAWQTRYGNFAISVLLEVKEVDPSAPKDILTFGENWCQLVESRDCPNNNLESLPQSQGALFLGEMWPIRGRSENDIFDLMRAIQEGVRAGSLDERILRKLAVLDLTSINPPVSERDLYQRVDTPWGVNGRLRGSNTLIYHITSGYARQSVQDLPNSPGDDTLLSLFLRGQKKWK